MTVICRFCLMPAAASGSGWPFLSVVSGDRQPARNHLRAQADAARRVDTLVALLIPQAFDVLAVHAGQQADAAVGLLLARRPETPLTAMST